MSDECSFAQPKIKIEVKENEHCFSLCVSTSSFLFSTEVSYVVLTQSRPTITSTPPRAIVGNLDEIAAVTRKPADTQSEFFGRVVQRGTLLNNGKEMKIVSATNPDWRLIRKEDEEYFRQNTFKTQSTTSQTGDESHTNELQKHIPDIIKYWARAKG